MSEWKSYIGVGLALLGMLFGAGQWVGRLNERLDRLERQERYLHGTYQLPEGEK